MKYFRVKEKGKELIVRSCCETATELEVWVRRSKERYNDKYKDCGYKVRDFELKDMQFENDEALTVIKIFDTNIVL